MKVIVAKKNHPQYIGISSTGEFVKFKHHTPLEVGVETNIHISRFKMTRSLVGIAAAAFFVFASVAGYAYNTPTSYLYVDINPSIELSVNCFDRVIDAKGLNEDGKTVVSQTALKNLQPTESLEQIIQKSIEKEYLKENSENMILVNTSGNQEQVKKLEEKINKMIDHEKIKKVRPEVILNNVDARQLQEAKKQHISAGKLKIVEQVAKENPNLSKEQLSNMSVKELVKQFKPENSGWKRLSTPKTAPSEKQKEQPKEQNTEPKKQVEKQKSDVSKAQPAQKEQQINKDSQDVSADAQNSPQPKIKKEAAKLKKHIQKKE